MQHIDYKYRANSKGEFHKRYLEILEDDFDIINSEFSKLRDGLNEYTNKQKWVNQIWKVLST
jgi:sugar-specific transcriptional regulator TrmB